jgi:hypothetical protein
LQLLVQLQVVPPPLLHHVHQFNRGHQAVASPSPGGFAAVLIIAAPS